MTDSAPSAPHGSTPEEKCILAGLEKVEAGGPRLMIDAARGDKTNIEFRLTRQQWALLALLKHSAHLMTQRSVSNAIVLRRALEVYSRHLQGTLGDPRATEAEAQALRKCRK